MDSPEVTVARYAARISLWAFGVSAGSLAIAFGVFALEVRRWFDEGVRLSISVIVDAKFFGGIEKDDQTYLAVTVTNRGSAATTITHMVLFNYPNTFGIWLPKRPRFLARLFKKHLPKTFIVANTGEMRIPYVLEPGRNWHGTAVHTPDLEGMIAAGRLFVGIIGSHSDKPLFMRIRRWKPPGNAKAA